MFVTTEVYSMNEAVQENVWILGNRLMNDLDPNNEEDARIVQRGLLLFHQQLVYPLRIEEDEIHGYVQDVVPVRVRLMFHSLLPGECSCPQEGICRHQMAVFFAAYGKYKSVAEWLDLWKQQMPKFREQPLAKSGVTMTKIPFDYEAWQKLVEQCFAEQGRFQPYLFQVTFDATLRKIRSYTPNEQEWKHLYLFVTSFFVFQKVITLLSEEPNSEMGKRGIPILHKLMRDMEDAVEELTNHPLPFSYDPFFERIKKDGQELLFFEDPYRNERLFIYWLIWSRLLTKSTWRKEELAYIEKLKKRSNPDSDVAHAFSLLSVLEGNVHEALQQLDRSLPNGIHIIFHWLDYFSTKKLWKPYLLCLEFLQARMRSILPFMDEIDLIYPFTRNVISYVKTYTQEHKKSDIYEKMMLELLPYSRYELERYYLDGHQYKKWMDLLFWANEYNYISKDTLKLVQSEAPETLLPYFHRQVSEAIERKNRQSYKEAVRALKKLRSIYKKLKKTQHWEDYFSGLLEETKRLRAFHEELKRAKMIENEE